MPPRDFVTHGIAAGCRISNVETSADVITSLHQSLLIVNRTLLTPWTCWLLYMILELMLLLSAGYRAANVEISDLEDAVTFLWECLLMINTTLVILWTS